MKIAVTLIIGIVLGSGIAYAGIHFSRQSDGNAGFAGLHSRADDFGSQNHIDETAPQSAMNLMQTDIALCDQPYFIEVYKLTVSYFAKGIENIRAEDYSEVLFDHARNSGFFSSEEAEDWIQHIKDVPRQSVEIFRENPSVFNTCYGFQVAAVGPPA